MGLNAYPCPIEEELHRSTCGWIWVNRRAVSLQQDIRNAELPPEQSIGKLPFFGVAALAIISVLFGGVVGLLMVGAMWWISSRRWVRDDPLSHGISEQDSSRLGGFIVAAGYVVFALLSSNQFSSSNELEQGFVSPLVTPPSLVLWGLIAMVGMWDDFVSNISASGRLALVSILSLLWVMITPGTVQLEAFAWLPAPLAHEAVLAVACAFIITAFVNAGNMADGANGLLSGICLAFFAFTFFEVSSQSLYAIIMALSIFIIFNVSTGKIFLGDFGSYGLSSGVAMTALVLYGTGEYTMWLLASIVSYPCIELVRVFAQRAARKVSPMQAGDDHLHNFLYRVCRQAGLGRVAANSLTGCTIAAVSAGVPSVIALTGVLERGDTAAWLGYFVCYILLHVVACRLLKVTAERTAS